MPRPNKRREIFAEDHLAQRIAAERDARGWTNDGLAKRMTDAGCPMTGSAIFKIERAVPRRRIVVDELVAFAKVFAVPMEELLIPPSLATRREMRRLALEIVRLDRAIHPLKQARVAAVDALIEFLDTDPQFAKQKRAFAEMVAEMDDDDPRLDEIYGSN
jgi:transcriptional regulator with XRE-family HTH domain